jgi:hypothetical protein
MFCSEELVKKSKKAGTNWNKQSSRGGGKKGPRQKKKAKKNDGNPKDKAKIKGKKR